MPQLDVVGAPLSARRGGRRARVHNDRAAAAATPSNGEARPPAPNASAYVRVVLLGPCCASWTGVCRGKLTAFFLRGTHHRCNTIAACEHHRAELTQLGIEGFNAALETNVYAIARRVHEDWLRDHPEDC